MPNHYHLLVHTPEGNLSRFMRHVNGVYTQSYNRKHKRDGPLFRGRFKAILVEEDSYFLEVIKYIHRNPVKAGLSESNSGYKWSSHKHFLSPQHKTVPKWMETDYILGYFSNRQKDAVAGYKTFMRQKMDEEVEKFYAKNPQSPILGDASFVERVKAKYIFRDRELNLEIKGERVMRGLAKVSAINKTVCQEFKVDENSLLHSIRGEENTPGQTAIYLSRELTGLSLVELAKAYKTVASCVYRFKSILNINKKLANTYRLLKRHCSQDET